MYISQNQFNDDELRFWIYFCFDIFFKYIIFSLIFLSDPIQGHQDTTCLEYLVGLFHIIIFIISITAVPLILPKVASVLMASSSISRAFYFIDPLIEKFFQKKKTMGKFEFLFALQHCFDFEDNFIDMSKTGSINQYKRFINPSYMQIISYR